MLEGLGWTIHRVWSKAWILNPEFELDSIEASISAARSRTLAPTPAALTSSTELDHADTSGWEQATDDAAPFDVATGEPPRLFDEYETASLEDIKVGPELQHEVSPVLNRLILSTVETEMPVHLELVITRIRERYGLRRAGNVVRNRVEEAIGDAVRRGTVSWVPTVPGESDSAAFLIAAEADVQKPRPRRSRAGEQARRIDQISMGEIEAGLVLVVGAMFGGERESVIMETARQLGYQRTGPDISSRIGEAISHIVGRGELVESNGMLSLATEQMEARRLRRQDSASSPEPASNPAPLSQLADVSVADLEALGFEVIDKRGAGGALWVVGGPELRNQLVPRGFKFAEHGGRATGKSPAWYFMPS